MNKNLFVLSPLVVLLLSCQAEPPRETPSPLPAEEAARQVIRPDGFPSGAPYSPGILSGDTLYIAGQLGRDPVSGQEPEGIGEQTHQAMRNIGAVLKAAGMDYPNLVTCNVYLGSMDDYAEMNQAYGSYFPERVPTRTTIEPGGLPRQAGIEITCLGYREAGSIEVVKPEEGKLPKPLGPYSPAIRAGRMLYLSGMGGQDPALGKASDDFAQQVRQTLTNINETLKAAGLGMADVVSANVFITQPDGFSVVDQIFQEAGISAPRGNYLVRRLPGGIQAEITFVARQAGGEGEPGEAPLILTAAAGAAQAPDSQTQLRSLFESLKEQLSQAGRGPSGVASVFVYLEDMQDFESMNEVYRELFAADPPVRTTVQVLSAGAEDGVRHAATLIVPR